MAGVGKTAVLVTGMSGLIGQALCRHLEGRYSLRALNRQAVPGIACHQADIADLQAIRPAFAGVDVVVHLAAVASSKASLDELLGPNIVGTYNVFEAARRAGVRRVIFASSGATIAGYERDAPYSALVSGHYAEVGSWAPLTHEHPVRPAALYGCTKVWGEALARHYADEHGLSMLCIRIGQVNLADRPSATRQFSVWCSQRDVARMIEACITAPPSLRYDLFFATSKNRWGYRDLEHARAVLGFEPLDVAEDYREGSGRGA
jgi:nucleoside-diphosphate-sugar epimerase